MRHGAETAGVGSAQHKSSLETRVDIERMFWYPIRHLRMSEDEWMGIVTGTRVAPDRHVRLRGRHIFPWLALVLLGCAVGAAVAATPADPAPAPTGGTVLCVSEPEPQSAPHSPAAESADPAETTAEGAASEAEAAEAETRADEEQPGFEKGKDGGPILHAIKVNSPPVIDGNLDDPCWEQATRVSGFWYDTKQRPLCFDTEAYICYDDECIYAAFRCHDPEPNKIYARETKRNGRVWRDDLVELGIDCCHRHQETYWFHVTPRGTQNEDIPGGSASKIEWRGDWEAAGRIVEDGWTAEMAIPFKILRYPKGQKVFGINFSRRIRRKEEGGSWPPMKPRWDSYKMADLVDLDLPTIRRPPVVMPYTMADVGADDDPFVAGVDLKHTSDRGITTVATLNPDFKNIEEQIDTIDFSYTERRLEERRPFFSEGGWGYFPAGRMFYSRRIEDVDLGVKTFGSLGPHSFGFLDTVSFGEQNNMVAKYKYQLAKRTQVYTEHVRRDENSFHNWAQNVEFRHHKPIGRGDFNAAGGYQWTGTTGADNNGDAFWLSTNRWGGEGNLFGGLHYESISPDYNVVNAFVPEVDRRGIRAHLGMWKKWDERKIRDRFFEMRWDTYDHFDGSLFHTGWGGHIGTGWRNGNHYSLGYSNERRPPYSDSFVSLGMGWGGNRFDREGGVQVSIGERQSGNYFFWSVNQGFRFGDELKMRLSFEAIQHDPADEEPNHGTQTILSANYDITPERGYGARLVLRKGKPNFYASYRRRAARGTDVYVIVGDPNAARTEARVAVKLVKTVW